MMRTALTTAELLEAIPRSVVLASLTNSLPAGVSLVKLELMQKQLKRSARGQAAASRYETGQANPSGSNANRTSEKEIETHLNIEGIAPSDLQVAAYIERLGSSFLLTNVALVESKEKKVDDASFRDFKLKAMLNQSVHLTKDDVEEIKAKAEHSVYHF